MVPPLSPRLSLPPSFSVYTSQSLQLPWPLLPRVAYLPTRCAGRSPGSWWRTPRSSDPWRSEGPHDGSTCGTHRGLRDRGRGRGGVRANGDRDKGAHERRIHRGRHRETREEEKGLGGTRVENQTVSTRLEDPKTLCIVNDGIIIPSVFSMLQWPIYLLRLRYSIYIDT